jgi:tetratricopeptide (TPR) repeat protein
MKNIIITLALTLAVAMSLALDGCSADYDRVIKESTRAIEKNPSDIEAYRARGRAWEEKGDYDGAIADCNKAIEIDPGGAKPYYFRCNLYSKKGDYDQAILDCTKAIELDSDDAYAYYFRARAWEGKGDFEKAIKDCTKAIKKSQMIWMDVELHRARAQLWLKTGKVDRYEEDLAKAKELSDSIPGGQKALD